MDAAVQAQLGMAKFLRALANPVPGIFFVLADVLFDHVGAEELQRLEAGPVHLLGGAEHGVGLHVQRPQALLAVAQGGVDERNVFHSGLFFADGLRGLAFGR